MARACGGDPQYVGLVARHRDQLGAPVLELLPRIGENQKKSRLRMRSEPGSSRTGMSPRSRRRAAGRAMYGLNVGAGGMV